MEEWAVSLLAAAIGAGVAGLIELIIFLCNRFSHKRDEEVRKKEMFFEKKEQSYTYMMEMLSFIRRGLQFQNGEIYEDNSPIREEYDDFRKKSESYPTIIRMYASNEMFVLYDCIFKYYEPYAYTNLKEKMGITTNIFANSFELYFIYFSRLIQYDLGYRKYDKNSLLTISCPICGKDHDLFEKDDEEDPFVIVSALFEKTKFEDAIFLSQIYNNANDLTDSQEEQN